ncbi:MAG TPA: phosphotransferase [Thermoanaerobaculia bacterium]|nr:phosphotransferase [Thermoanaerobaculia bacterium]
MSRPADLIPVRDVHSFDPQGLERWLERHVAGYRGPVEVLQFAGGQSNPTYSLESPSGRYVLRRKPPGKLLPSAHAVDREYRVLTALRATGVPVARTFALCEDDDVIGTAFYVMEHVDGRVLRDPLLPGCKPAERAAIYDAMNATLAVLHRVDFVAVGLEDFGKQGEYVARQIHRWTKQYRASETVTITEMDRLIEWLPRHIPEDDETTLVHGDFRLENMIFHPTEPEVLAVLDWELSTLGHPLADLSYNCLLYRTDPDAFGGFGDTDLAALGIPTESEYVAAYCRRTGRESIDGWEFYMAFALFRIAAILQGIMGRVVDGTAAAKNAAERGAMAPAVARRGWEIAEGMGA